VVVTLALTGMSCLAPLVPDAYPFRRIGEIIFPGPSHFFRELVPAESAPSAQSAIVPELNERPPISLVIAWVLYYHALLDEDVESIITPIIFFIESASIDDFLDIWVLADDQEECLKQHLVVGPPDDSYTPWINDFPESWRDSIALLTSQNWQDLGEAIATRLTALTFLKVTSTREPLSFPDHGLIWLGSLLWIILEDPAGRAYNSPIPWFDAWDDLDSFVEPLILPPVTPTTASQQFTRSVIDSGHTCWSDYSDLMHWYASMISWMQQTNKVAVIPLEIADDPPETFECEACAGIIAVDEPPTQMRPSMDLKMLCDLLCIWSTPIDPWHDPLDWLSANHRNLLWVLREATNLNEDDIPLGNLMYPVSLVIESLL
jgi:hypothetical protein